MSASHFQFKQFTVHQERCAMKVSTDACIQGAITPVNASEIHRVLDIGTGTGLLSLMLAQRLPDAMIDAVESDEEAAAQAAENVVVSPFASRIRVMQADVLAWGSDTNCYDLIICNPPFFINSLRGPDAARNAARHAAALNAVSLSGLIAQYLCDGGTASVMWPPDIHSGFSEAAQKKGLNLHEHIAVSDRDNSRVTRIISIWSKMPVAESIASRFIIKDAQGAYTAQAASVLRPFYLHL